jgi:hypothetical protein
MTGATSQKYTKTGLVGTSVRQFRERERERERESVCGKIGAANEKEVTGAAAAYRA